MPAAVFLVEGYAPAPGRESLERFARSLESAAGDQPSDMRVRHLHSSVVPADDICLCLIEGPSPDVVAGVAERAGLRVMRVSEAIHVSGPDRRPARKVGGKR